jgi:hypothetical protein
MTVMTQIDFKTGIANKDRKARSASALPVIPLPPPISDRPSPPRQTDKSAGSSRLRRAPWQGPDLVPSSASLDTGETLADETLSDNVPPERQSEQDNGEYVNNASDNDEEGKDGDTSHSDMFVAEEKETRIKELTPSEIESALRVLD